MRTVAEHLAACLEIARPAAPLDVVLPDAVGCVLAGDVVAEIDLPASDLAAVDGYAVALADVAQAAPERPVVLDVVASARAGGAQAPQLVPGTAVLIDSGAPLPRGAQAVVAWEDTDRGVSRVRVRARVVEGLHVRRRAGDVAAGTTVLRRGERISARQIALLAGTGRQRVTVHPAPRVVVVSVGDELIEPGGVRENGRVYDANGHALASAATEAGGRAYRVSAVPDELGALREALEDQLVRADVLITTGGLSAGQGDTVKEVLAPLGTVRFDTVSMARGGPGREGRAGQLGVGTVEGTPVFCLPGDPVSAQIAFEVFVRPVLRQIAGRTGLHRPSVRARVSHGWHSPSGLREFVPVSLSGSPARGYRAEPTSRPGESGLQGLARANAIAVVPEEARTVVEGDELHCLVLES